MAQMSCNRYGDVTICLIFMIIPIVFGSILNPLAWLQMYSDWKIEKGDDQQALINSDQVILNQRIGHIVKDIHRTVFGCSPMLMIGWLLNTIMDNAFELLVADIFIDVVTVSLAYMLWIIALEKLDSWYYEQTGTAIERLPRLVIDTLAIISIVWVVVNNSLNYYYDRLWPRACFYYYLAFIFAFGIVLLTSLVVILTCRVKSLPYGKPLWALMILVLIVGGAAIPSQIMDGTNILLDRETRFDDKLPEAAVPFSLIFMIIQGLMLLAGLGYAWVKPAQDPNLYQPVPVGQSSEEQKYY